MTNFWRFIRWFAPVLIFQLIQVAFPVVSLSQNEWVEPWDGSSIVDYRKPPVEEINTLKKNPAYNFDGHQDEMSLFQRLMLKALQWLFNGISGRAWLLYVIGGLVMIGILLLILRFLNVPFSGLFTFSRGSSVEGLEMMHPAEGLSRDEMDKMFQMYRNNGAYREAVRILYLMYLKNLHINGSINLRINKTNRDYARELKDDTASKNFKKLSRLYNFVWFGQFNIAHHEYVQIEKEFNLPGLSDSLKSRANG
jgi:hypothetical protein